MGKTNSFFEDYLNEKYSDYVERTADEVKVDVEPDIVFTHEFRVGWVNPVSTPQEVAFFRKIENVFRLSSAVKDYETMCILGTKYKSYNDKKLLTSKSGVNFSYHDDHESDILFSDSQIQRMIEIKFTLNETAILPLYLFLYNLLGEVCSKFPETANFNSQIRARIRRMNNKTIYRTLAAEDMRRIKSYKNNYELEHLFEVLDHDLDSPYIPNEIVRWQFCQQHKQQINDHARWIDNHYEISSLLYATEFTCQRYSHQEWLDSLHIEVKGQSWRELALRLLIAREALIYIDRNFGSNHLLVNFMKKHLFDETEFVISVTSNLEDYPFENELPYFAYNYKNTARKIGQYALDNAQSKKMSLYCKLIEQAIEMLQITLDRRRIIIDDSAVPCLMLEFKENEQ